MNIFLFLKWKLSYSDTKKNNSVYFSYVKTKDHTESGVKCDFFCKLLTDENPKKLSS